MDPVTSNAGYVIDLVKVGGIVGAIALMAFLFMAYILYITIKKSFEREDSMAERLRELEDRSMAMQNAHNAAITELAREIRALHDVIRKLERG